MNEILEKTARIRDITVHYLVAGSGTPLLLIHGYAGEARKWRNNINLLSATYTVYAPDLPGFGNSQPLDGTYYIPELVDFIESFVSGIGLERFFLVGHSLGGGIAVNYALKNTSRVIKLVLVDSLCLGKEIAWWARLLSRPAKAIGVPVMAGVRFIKWVGHKARLPFEFVFPLSQSGINLGSCIATFRQQTLVVADRLSELFVPTLLVWGEADPLIPVKHAYRAAGIIPDCRLKVFEHTGHNIYLDYPAGFSLALSEFLG